jgi:hypothetical protein
MKQLITMTLAVFLSIGAICSFADESSPSPEQLVSLYYQKMGEKDMTSLADYMHSGELAKFKKMMLPVFEAGFASGKDPGILKAFTQGDTLKQIQDYSPRKFFSRFLRWVMIIKPGIDEVLKQSTIKPIGHVSEQTTDGEIIHVVFRMTSSMEGMRISKLSVMSLKQDGKAWKLMLTGEIEGIAQALQQQIKRRGQKR